MGFLKNMADKGQAAKLYVELREMQTAWSQLNEMGRDQVYRQILDILGRVADEIQILNADQQVVLGIKMAQGCLSNVHRDPWAAIPRWTIAAHLISFNIAASDKQREVVGWTRRMIKDAGREVAGVELDI
jgi:hypothetical protein